MVVPALCLFLAMRRMDQFYPRVSEAMGQSQCVAHATGLLVPIRATRQLERQTRADSTYQQYGDSSP